MDAADRRVLDVSIKKLSEAGGGLSLDDFRLAQQTSSRLTAKRIRAIVISMSIAFLLLSFLDLTLGAQRSDSPSREFLFAGLWSVSLGGLGAISNIFLDILKLIPQQTLRSNDQFEVICRIILGVLFAFVLGLTVSNDIPDFFYNMQNGLRQAPNPAQAGGRSVQNIMLLLPFIAGYSLPLVLGLLEKAIKAIELTIGIDDRRIDPTQERVKVGKRGR